MLTEIYLCHACSCHALEDGNARAAAAAAAAVPNPPRSTGAGGAGGAVSAPVSRSAAAWARDEPLMANLAREEGIPGAGEADEPPPAAAAAACEPGLPPPAADMWSVCLARLKALLVKHAALSRVRTLSPAARARAFSLCTGAGGDNGIAKMWNRREISVSSDYDDPMISTRTRICLSICLPAFCACPRPPLRVFHSRQQTSGANRDGYRPLH
eukprot:COSAG01_NODE_99_length_26583_cov_79.512536_5_plen_213_part_00